MRSFLAAAALALSACSPSPPPPPPSVAPLRLESFSQSCYDFSAGTLEGWRVLAGRWTMVEGERGGELLQSATTEDYCTILAPGPAAADVDLRVRFRSRAGLQDASGGLVFRWREGCYYVLRANCLEYNLRLYAHREARREMIAGTRIGRLERNTWHRLRVVAVGPRIQAWLNGELVLEARVEHPSGGRVGLWTKADAVTAFDDLEIRRSCAEGDGRGQ